MFSAADARRLTKHIWTAQLEQIERAIKETIIIGGTCIYYKTDMLDDVTIEWLKLLDYKVHAEAYGKTKISWEV
jgi:glutamine amidotransferase PdxT